MVKSSQQKIFKTQQSTLGSSIPRRPSGEREGHIMGKARLGDASGGEIAGGQGMG